MKWSPSYNCYVDDHNRPIRKEKSYVLTITVGSVRNIFTVNGNVLKVARRLDRGIKRAIIVRGQLLPETELGQNEAKRRTRRILDHAVKLGWLQNSEREN